MRLLDRAQIFTVVSGGPFPYTADRNPPSLKGGLVAPEWNNSRKEL
jgi:hypothetical protein